MEPSDLQLRIAGEITTEEYVRRLDEKVRVRQLNEDPNKPIGLTFLPSPPRRPLTWDTVEKLREMGASDELLRSVERAVRRQERKPLWRRLLRR